MASAKAQLTKVTSSATTVKLLDELDSREGLIVENDSSAVLYLRFGTGAAVATDYTVKLAAGARYEMNSAQVYTGEIHAIWASANGFAYCTELTG